MAYSTVIGFCFAHGLSQLTFFEADIALPILHVQQHLPEIFFILVMGLCALLLEGYISKKEIQEKIRHEDETYEDTGNMQYYLGYTAALEWVLSQISQGGVKEQ